MEKFDFLKHELGQLEKTNLIRKPPVIESGQGPTVMINGQEKLLFCSNNYLSLANHPLIIESVCDAVRQYGFGAGASRLVSGSMQIHQELEARLAGMFGKEAALLFPSGWTANEGLLRSIIQKGDMVLLDKLDHASIIDALRTSEAEFKTFRKNTLSRLEKDLSRPGYNRKYIVTESIFSMDGDAADLKRLVELKTQHNAILIVDEAHALGCLGGRGAGLAEELGIVDQVDIVVGTLSKAFASNGGVVAGPKVLRDYLVNKARSFIYTTAPSVATCAAAMATMDIIAGEPARKSRLKSNADYLRQQLCSMGLDTGQSSFHIIPVIIGSEEDTLRVSAQLFEMGFFIAAIRPPTVAPGTSRLRISLQADHTREQIDSLIKALGQLIERGVLKAGQCA